VLDLVVVVVLSLLLSATHPTSAQGEILYPEM
jgi:hypothetical protein